MNRTIFILSLVSTVLPFVIFENMISDTDLYKTKTIYNVNEFRIIFRENLIEEQERFVTPVRKFDVFYKYKIFPNIHRPGYNIILLDKNEMREFVIKGGKKLNTTLVKTYKLNDTYDFNNVEFGFVYKNITYFADKDGTSHKIENNEVTVLESNLWPSIVFADFKIPVITYKQEQILLIYDNYYKFINIKNPNKDNFTEKVNEREIEKIKIIETERIVVAKTNIVYYILIGILSLGLLLAIAYILVDRYL